jgi:hypothetical protein
VVGRHRLRGVRRALSPQSTPVSRRSSRKGDTYERTRRKLIPHVKLGQYLRSRVPRSPGGSTATTAASWRRGRGEAGPSEPVPSPARRRGRPFGPLPQSRGHDRDLPLQLTGPLCSDEY